MIHLLLATVLGKLLTSGLVMVIYSFLNLNKDSFRADSMVIELCFRGRDYGRRSEIM